VNLRYRIIQFVADPYREEGRNVALVAYANEKTYLRALGMDENGHVNYLWFERLLTESQKEDAWVYREWANWWRELVGEGVKNSETVDDTLNRLNAKGGSMMVTDGGILEMPDEDEPQVAVEWLYRRLIGDEDIFIRDLDRVLEVSEIKYQKGFMRDVAVRLNPLSEERGHEIDIHFPYLIDPSPGNRQERTAFKVIRFVGIEQEDLLRGVNDVIYSFEIAQRRGYLDTARCIVLTDSPLPEHQNLYDRLALVAGVIDITADDASSRILRVFIG
jgi:hypothetical protein